MKTKPKNKKKVRVISKIQDTNQKGMDSYKKDFIRKQVVSKFAKEMAQLVFEIGIERESTFIDVEDNVPYEFIEKMVDVKKHATAIKKRIEGYIFDEVMADYDSFIDEGTGKLSNQNDLEEYTGTITQYCIEQYELKQSKKEKVKKPTHVVIPIEYFEKQIKELNESIRMADYFGGTTDKVIKGVLEKAVAAGKKITVEPDSDGLNIFDQIEVENR